MRKPKPPPIACVTQKIAIALAALQREAADAGMFRSMHAINKASQVLGWEAARLLQKQHRTKG
jgi:hypothetical protein